MTRFVYAGLFILLLLPHPASADVEEGKNYQKLPFPVAVDTGNKIEVREIFWYGCPHCYVLEPGLTRWLKKMPSNAQFVRTPGTVSPNWLLHAQTYYTFEAMGVLEKMHGAFFKAVQEQHGQLNSEEAITKFAASQGVDAKKFSEAFNSFGVRMRLEKAKQLNQDLNINSVPTVVVDGKYLTSPAMAEGEEKFFQVLDFLINKAAKERKKKAAKS
ncbi:MAG: thiol:disulfide interchange protein DsbA/DsbL [Gammaproteobacteria bacterium]|nr:thiol:disulfide interchange protein DsbA/DsbL [Gammaproteobacteria bacterium]